MKRLVMSFFVAVCAGAVCADEATVSVVSVRPRWPWSPKVDVVYDYSGEAPGSVRLTATWRGQAEPVDLVGLETTGAFLVTNGRHRVSWDPVAAGVGDKTLVDFRVQAAAVADDPRTYLVVDLVNGGYETLSAVPEGGWTDVHKTTKMVFRRIPAGTYALGYPMADFFQLEAENGWSRPVAQGMAPRTVTLTSDFYHQVFLTTVAQAAALQGLSSAVTNPKREHTEGYALFRGATLDDGTTAVDWPATGYSVAADSLVGKLRQKLGGGLLADLPTQEQWEIAMRAGTDTLWPSGGSPDCTAEELTNAVHAISWCKWIDGTPLAYNRAVGLKQANRWGVYDFNVLYEATLSWANDAEAITHTDKKSLNVAFPSGGLDPLGPAASCHEARIFMGGDSNGSGLTFRNLATSARTGVSVTGSPALYCGLRFAIHLAPLVR